MNAVFEPSLLFISDKDWNDPDIRDAFLEHLLNHLEMIETHDLCSIYWTDELQTILVQQPNMHPWFGSDLRNPIVVAIVHRFYSRLEIIDELDDFCEIIPAFKINYSVGNAYTHFLYLIHMLMHMDEEFYICIGIENKISIPSTLLFHCTCHGDFTLSTIINSSNDWLNLITINDKYFPKEISEFEEKFYKGMELVRAKYFKDKNYIFDFEFTKVFKKSVLAGHMFSEQILVAVVKKLILTSQQAGSSDLHDEFISNNQINEWRIRVTQRPSSTRIHYDLGAKGKIRFLKFYGEGEHDDGL